MSHLSYTTHMNDLKKKKKKLSQSACTIKLKLTNKDMYPPSTMRGTDMVKLYCMAMEKLT